MVTLLVPMEEPRDEEWKNQETCFTFLQTRFGTYELRSFSNCNTNIKLRARLSDKSPAKVFVDACVIMVVIISSSNHCHYI